MWLTLGLTKVKFMIEFMDELKIELMTEFFYSKIREFRKVIRIIRIIREFN